MWFIDQVDINCRGLAVGYARRSYYEDTTAVKNAILNAADNYVKLLNNTITGDQNFWSTAIGNAWMGSSYKEIYDSFYVGKVSESLNIIDIYKLDDYLILLASKDECEISDAEKVLVSGSVNPKPGWIKNLPVDDIYNYAIGSSEVYHYAESSWLNAERNARLTLARTLNSSIKAVQLFSSNENQAIINESLDLKLQDLEIVNRWIDSTSNIFYVLIRCQKKI